MGAYPVQQQYVAPGQQKSWIATLLLCFFLGSFGAHNFYTGRTTFGVSQLVLNILGSGLPSGSCSDSPSGPSSVFGCLLSSS
nr:MULTISPECIES: TM2 domain-containing protein [unclassified Corynebacterium]